MIILYKIVKEEEYGWFDIELDINDNNLEFTYEYKFCICDTEVDDFIKFTNDSYNSIHNREKNFMHIFSHNAIPYFIMCTEYVIKFYDMKLLIIKPNDLLEIFKEICKDIEVGKFEVVPIFVRDQDPMFQSLLAQEFKDILEKFELNMY